MDGRSETARSRNCDKYHHFRGWLFLLLIVRLDRCWQVEQCPKHLVMSGLQVAVNCLRRAGCQSARRVTLAQAALRHQCESSALVTKVCEGPSRTQGWMSPLDASPRPRPQMVCQSWRAARSWSVTEHLLQPDALLTAPANDRNSNAKLCSPANSCQ